MYNRYIPQPDGTHRRNRVPDPSRRHPNPPPPPKPEAPPPKESAPPMASPAKREPQKGGSVGNFLQQILPSNFDTGDLIVVLLLLLMAADSKEDQNTALLTLALYLIM